MHLETNTAILMPPKTGQRLEFLTTPAQIAIPTFKALKGARKMEKINDMILEISEKITSEEERSCQKNVEAVSEQHTDSHGCLGPLRMAAFDRKN